MKPTGHLVRLAFVFAAFLAAPSVLAGEPPPGSPERAAVLAALRSRVEIDLDTPIGFRVSRIDVSRGWAYVSAVPTRGRQDLDWATTRFAADFAADMMSNMVLALLTDRGGRWMVVEYALGPTDATWEEWIGRYRLPRSLFVPVDPTQERDPDTAPIEGLAGVAPTSAAPPAPVSPPAFQPVPPTPSGSVAASAPTAADVADLEKALDDVLGAAGAAGGVSPNPISPASPPMVPPAPDPRSLQRDVSPTVLPPPPLPRSIADGLAPIPAPGAPVLVENGAGGATRPGSTKPATFALRSGVHVTQLMTYHYGARRPPGTIALRHESGRTLGPWQANGAVGQGGVAHAYWWVRPNVRLEPGRWTVVDSDPASWSIEPSTNGAGIFAVWGKSLQ